MVDGAPDTARFAEVIGGQIRQLAHSHPQRHLRIFGELVALLCDAGNAAAAVRLEEMWNDLHETLSPFSLFCAYPLHGFAGERHAEAFGAICERHGRVLPAESYASLTSAAEREHAIALLQQRASALEAEVAEHRTVEERLRLSEAYKDLFIATASHELNTPVTSLKAFTQVLQCRLREQSDPQTLLLLDRMTAQLERLTRLISDLLDVSSMQTGEFALNNAIFAFDAMVRETVADVQAVTSSHLLEVRGVTGALVEGDRDRLAQVLTNLLTNAVRFSPNAERVIIRLSAHPAPEGATVEVAIQDFGLGIVEQHRERVFERFYQVAGAVGYTYPGLGIGLYIAREFVERHDGRLWLESRIGEGSTFHVVLPRSRKEGPGRPGSAPIVDSEEGSEEGAR